MEHKIDASELASMVESTTIEPASVVEGTPPSPEDMAKLMAQYGLSKGRVSKHSKARALKTKAAIRKRKALRKSK